MATTNFKFEPYKFGFQDPEEYLLRSRKGLDASVIAQISTLKGEPDWMLEKRLKAYQIFLDKELPKWGGDLSKLDFDQISYFLRAQDRPEKSWEEVPDQIRNTFERLGIAQTEQKYLAGVGAQYESEVVYHNLEKEWSERGVIFCDSDTALREYPDLVKQYFGTIIPAHDHKFAALNTAVWSGGSFVYIPKGVHLDIPLQTYFRINARGAGQFERTLIIADEGSYVHYVEGCSAPIQSSDSLHSAVVEVVVKKGARVRYTTIQNWSANVYNLVTKRATVQAGGTMEWVDCNLGSKLTMKYPAVFLLGRGAKAEVLSLAVAGEGQVQDAGSKIFHMAPDTHSIVNSKSISHSGGSTTYRGLISGNSRASNSKTKINCDALILDNKSRSDTIPKIENHQKDFQIEHEAKVSRLDQHQLFYARSRGLSENEAAALIVNGFLEPIVKELPMEYAIELNSLISLQMEGSVG